MSIHQHPSRQDPVPIVEWSSSGEWNRSTVLRTPRFSSAQLVGMPTAYDKSSPADVADSRMTGTETRGAAVQLSLTSAERLSHMAAPRPKILKEVMKDSVYHAVSLNSSDRLTVLYGHPAVSKITLQALVDCVLSDHPVVYLDGVHAFDMFLVERLARSRQQQPQKALEMIHVARAFNARQLERLMSHCLVDALERYQARTAAISGLLESISADYLTDKEVHRLTDRMIESLRHLTQRGFSLLCSCPSVPMPMSPAHRLFAILRSMSDRCLRVHEVQGKVVTEEISLNTMPVYTKPFENIGVGSTIPFQSSGQCATVHPRPRSSVG